VSVRAQINHALNLEEKGWYEGKPSERMCGEKLILVFPEGELLVEVVKRAELVGSVERFANRGRGLLGFIRAIGELKAVVCPNAFNGIRSDAPHDEVCA